MLLEQDKITKNLLTLNNEIESEFKEIEVNFNKTYLSYDKKYEWVDPTTTKKVYNEIIKSIIYNEHDIFIDCGSGLGYVIYLSSFIFKKVIGVEIIDDIFNESKKNLLMLIGNKKFYNQIELINGNVLTQRDSFYESGTIFYISSPFSEESDLRILLNKIVDSLKRKNRKLYVIYYYPYFRTLFDEYNDYFKLIKEINIIGQVLIYEHELI